jgi:hypothetical protein
MIGIKVNGRFLDIKPGLTAETERISPFFALSESIGEYTTPLTFKYTENNAIALGLVYQYYSKRQKLRVEAELYDGNVFECKCLLVIETGKMNLNRIGDSEMNGYALFGVSQFYQLYKGKFLHDLKLGGVRTFNYTTQNVSDGSNGYWQHFHQTWTNENIPYVFQPTRNDRYYGEDNDVDWMNKMGDGGTLLFDFRFPLVPFVRLKYLLECIFAEVGFTVDFTGLNDEVWKKIILYNLTRIDWTTVAFNVAQNDVVRSPKATIQIDLSKHVPQDVSISGFLIALFGRFGWAPVFDIIKKKCRFVAGKQLGRGTRKDWTQYAEPVIDSDFNEDPKIFGFKNEIDSNDSFPEKGDFTNAKFRSQVDAFQNLTAPTPEMDGRIVYAYLENRYYQVKEDEATSTFKWVPFSENIFDYEPANANEIISTSISTIPTYYTLYRHSVIANKDYYGFFPVVQQEHNTKAGLRFLLYHGMVAEREIDYITLGGSNYPHASNNRLSLGPTPTAWSNTYSHIQIVNGVPVDYGIIPYWWKWFLNILQSGEENKVRIRLPLHELISFAWDDEILIQNISYLVKSFVKPMPYRGFVEATLKRLDKKVVVMPAGSGTGNLPVANVIYAKLIVHNIVIKFNQGAAKIRHCDVKIYLYSDAAGTIPYTPAQPLYVYVRRTENRNNSFYGEMQDYYGVTAASQDILKNVSYNWEGMTSPSATGQIVYSLDPSGANDYVVI